MDVEVDLRTSVHEFASTVLRPAATALDRLPDPAAVVAERSPLWRALRQAWRLGWHKAALPATVGGLGLDGLGQHVVLEELGWGSADLATAIAVAGLPAATAAASGIPDLIDRFVTPFVDDVEARVIGCWAITEPGHGSDALAIGTPHFEHPRVSADVVARRDRDYWVISGRKADWVANGTIATVALTFLGVDPGRGMAGGGVALVPLHIRGVSRGAPVDKLGQRALDQAGLVFDDVRVHESCLVTDPTLYEFVLDRTIAWVSAATAAIFTGVARAAYDAALDYARDREQGGKPICEHQLVQKRLFDMFARVEACRAFSRAALVRTHATVPPPTEYAIAAKTFCTEAALAVASDAVQLFGGNGLSRAYPVEKLFRDARTALIQNGTSDVLALVAAPRLLASGRTTRVSAPGAA
ncbi:MAG TPA: acyl-CoA dehydrogenase family protein [Candidatus Binatia bacterium]|nr:acyl-CoA dehydrogenase family protein [Candidatus Binatia bacterium]